MSDRIRVTVWNEFVHEREMESVRKLYPEGMHRAIGSYLAKQPGLSVGYATLQEPEHGLSEEVLQGTDVLTWWGHAAHEEVQDEVVHRVQRHVLEGMGLIVLHSGHYSKIFRRLMGTDCSLRWREAAEKERLWNLAPDHPITQGIGEYLELPHEEMYGERFDIPEPDELLFISWFQGGEVFRSGACWRRGHGRVFYFRPGHETYPTYHNLEVLRVIGNAARWAAARIRREHTAPQVPPLEKLPGPEAESGGGVAGVAPASGL
jgi:trehalose utilization protein